MTPKEKAVELVNKYSIYVVMWAGGIEVTGENVKQCALIAVDEILFSLNSITDKYIELGVRMYWHEVKTEIENL